MNVIEKKYMKRKQFTYMLIGGITMLSFASCTKDLNLVPTNDITASTVYSTPEGFRSGLAKVYGSFALTGNTGGGGGSARSDTNGTVIFETVTMARSLGIHARLFSMSAT